MKMATKKRAYERIPLDMKVSFVHFNTRYTGTIKDISKNGMYIESDAPLPFNSKFELYLSYYSKLRVFLKFNNTILGVSVRVIRLVNKGDAFIGMGVMLLNQSQSYMDFLSSLTQTNSKNKRPLINKVVLMPKIRSGVKAERL
jgi:hypothetical protein